jgi:hypothetical protein
MNIALKKDIDKQYLEAVSYYENDISSDEPASVDSYVNLAFLYWEFAAEHFEFNIPNNIPSKWSIIGGERFEKIIKMGLEKYPDSLELHFWQKYLPHRLFNNVFTESECENLLDKYGRNTNVVPYFFLYLFDEKKYEEQKKALLVICNTISTAKNIYIRSLLL